MIWLSEDNYMKTYGKEDYKTRVTNNIVCWMNYKITGIPLSQDKNGIMKVISWISGSPYIDSFLVRADRHDENFICPFRQCKDGTKWAHVITSKMVSNKNIWVIKVFGCDDASYTCHYLELDKMKMDIRIIKDRGISTLNTWTLADFFVD